MIGRAYRTGRLVPSVVRPECGEARRRSPWSSPWSARCSAVVGRAPAPAVARRARGDVQVGELTLKPCKVVQRALCGSIRRPWEPGNPVGRPGEGRLRVRAGPDSSRRSARWCRTRAVRATARPAPAPTTPRCTARCSTDATCCSSTSAAPVCRSRCAARTCRTWCSPYNVAAGRCGRSLGDRADDYASARSADDLAAVIAKLGLPSVSLYGDSYGTFFTQVFAGRHPELVRSIVLDGAYPTYGETGWYPTQGPAMRDAFTKVCRRSPECRSAGRAFLPTLRAVLAAGARTAVARDGVRRRGHAGRGDGRRRGADQRGVRCDVRAGVLPGADRRPPLRPARRPRAAAPAGRGGGRRRAPTPGPVKAYSEGLDAAVACHDYPQLYDMTAPPGAVRERQLRPGHRARGPGRTPAPTARSPSASTPTPTGRRSTGAPAGRWRPRTTRPGRSVRAGGYPDVPVLVLSGELDSITTAAEGDLVAEQFPNARHVVVRNSFHVTAIGDRDDCAERILRAFVRSPGSERRRVRLRRGGRAGACAGARAAHARRRRARAAGRALPIRLRRAGPAAALTVADVVDRWWNNYSGSGVGLRGGTFSYTGDDVVKLRLERVPPAAGPGRLRPRDLGPRPAADDRGPDARRRRCTVGCAAAGTPARSAPGPAPWRGRRPASPADLPRPVAVRRAGP